MVCLLTLPSGELVRGEDPPTGLCTSHTACSDPRCKSGLSRIKEPTQIVQENRKLVAEMVGSAERVQEDLKQLLEFKQQQQSNAWEMKYSRHLAQQGRRQNNVGTAKFTLPSHTPSNHARLTFVTITFVIFPPTPPNTISPNGVTAPLGTVNIFVGLPM
ncbi:hypothetical protein B0T25DRAFT_521367 [Lasiosphaeria hispida]|uniref:Uncharacterized protein n=1 Tax=Lasiosphaeria hispida TaxID=260671 RepID=A0AAJ0MBF1_9PEZI|nr:hypothetical protein B0T25DRAFT_521367 [Lasiosphaeria hispida]